jgi:hypothetical protein
MLGTVLWAYLDPGSGSMLMQLLVGGIAGIGVLLKVYGRTLLAFLSRKRQPHDA